MDSTVELGTNESESSP